MSVVKALGVGVVLIVIGLIPAAVTFVPMPYAEITTGMEAAAEAHLTHSRSLTLDPFYGVRLSYRLPAGARVEGTMHIEGGNDDIDFYVIDSGGCRVIDPGGYSALTGSPSSRTRATTTTSTSTTASAGSPTSP